MPWVKGTAFIFICTDQNLFKRMECLKLFKNFKFKPGAPCLTCCHLE